MRNDAVLVGLMVVLVALGLYVGYGYLRAQQDTRGYYTISVEFPSAKGISPGAPVMMSGVNIGRVKSVDLLTDRPGVNVKLHIKPTVQIPEGSTFRTPASILLPSEARIDVQPPPVYSGRYLARDSVAKGVSPTDLDKLLPDVGKTLEQIQGTLSSVRRFLDDPELNKAVISTMKNLAETAEHISNLTLQANRTLQANQGNINSIMREAALTAKEARLAIQSAHALIGDPALKDEAVAMLTSARKAAEHAEASLAAFQELTSDPETQENMKATLANAKELSDRLIDLTGQATELIEKASTFTDKATTLMEDGSEVAEAAKQTLSRINRTLGSSPSLASAFGFGEPTFQLDFLSDVNSNRYRTDTILSIPYRNDSFFYLGIYDFTETDRAIFQYGTKVNSDLSLRYGLYAAKPSVGVDYTLNNRTHLAVDLFNPNDLQVNFKIRQRLWENVFGWAGVEGIANGNRPTIGLQIQR